MNSIFRMFIVALCALFFSVSASAATVVTVSTVPAESVGLDSAGYWAGVIRLDIDGRPYLGMQIWWRDTYTPAWYTSPATWQSNLYTQDDIINGAPVLYGANLYSEAAPFFVTGLLGINPQDPGWTASFNEMAMNTLSGNTPALWSYTFGQGLMGVYNNMIQNSDPNLNYRQAMLILNASSQGLVTQRSGEFLVYPMATPVPPAIWLFGSGLLGLVAVARARTVHK